LTDKDVYESLYEFLPLEFTPVIVPIDEEINRMMSLVTSLKEWVESSLSLKAKNLHCVTEDGFAGI
jgi:hypothetical protein